ncbi:unnamed protein product [Pedinophyceae sp. YPF-701]|nr:unnamed protein product [Pedinophyceae sp. YPF-701]
MTSTEGIVRRHAFLQALLKRGCLEESEALRLFQELMESDDPSAFNHLLTWLNLGDPEDEGEFGLHSLHMAVRSLRNPSDGKVYVGVVNRLQDNVAKLGGLFTPAETAFFQKILETIAVAEEREIDHVEALNCRSGLKRAGTLGGDVSLSLSLTDAETALRTFVRERWLQDAGRGEMYRLGPRAFLELSDMIRDAASDENRGEWINL